MSGFRRVFFAVAIACLLHGGLFMPRCSTIFKYFRDLSGTVSDQSAQLEFDNDRSGTYDLELQVAFTASNVSSDWYVRILRTSSDQEILNGHKIVYAILFPENQRTQSTRPRAISVVFNNKVYCKDPVPGHAINVTTARNFASMTSSGLKPNCAQCACCAQTTSMEPQIRITNTAECGIRPEISPLIFEGSSIRKGEYPWLVALFVKEGDTYRFKCGGTLISNRHVITAAHCVVGYIEKNKLFAVFGGDSINNATANSTMRNVEKIVVHPEFKKPSDADIAVIVIKNSVLFADNIKPACLWDESISLSEGERGSIVGWGVDENGKMNLDEARQIEIPIVELSTCLLSNINFFHLASNRTFCAGARDGKIPCSGDSGSGFMVERNGRWKLRGIVSGALYDRKTKSCDGSNYAVFSDVSKYGIWLKEILEEH